MFIRLNLRFSNVGRSVQLCFHNNVTGISLLVTVVTSPG